jgi:hypothetical protein
MAALIAPTANEPYGKAIKILRVVVPIATAIDPHGLHDRRTSADHGSFASDKRLAAVKRRESNAVVVFPRRTSLARASTTGRQHLRALHDLPASCIVSQTANADHLIGETDVK